MKKIFLMLALTASLALTACSDETIAVSGGDITDGEEVSGGIGYDLVYADEMFAQELADRVKDRVFFTFDNYSLDAGAVATLKSQIAWLKANPEKNITLEGHCDERGTREYNLALGDRRANSVKRFMVANGVAPTRIKTISYGKERPAILGNNEAAWAQNRRTVTIIRD